jgi:hypothetical protein
VDDSAPQALARLRPHLGPLVGDPERVDGQHHDHPGQTFDYFAERTDGGRLAIEVVRAWDREWLEAEPAWWKLAAEVKAAAQQRDPTITGLYAMATRRSGNPRAKKYDPAALADALADCSRSGVGNVVVFDGVLSFRYVQDLPRLIIESARGVAEYVGGVGEESVAPFRAALTRKLDTMRRAGDAGYETHLAVVHWLLGTTHSWRQSLAEEPPEAVHPQHIWAVDLNVAPGSQGRSAAEQIWPIESSSSPSSRTSRAGT